MCWFREPSEPYAFWQDSIGHLKCLLISAAVLRKRFRFISSVLSLIWLLYSSVFFWKRFKCYTFYYLPVIRSICWSGRFFRWPVPSSFQPLKNFIFKKSIPALWERRSIWTACNIPGSSWGFAHQVALFILIIQTFKK